MELDQVHAVCSFDQLLLQWCFLPVILLCFPGSGGSYDHLYAYSCLFTHRASLSHLLHLCLLLLLACHLASSIWTIPCFLISACPMPVPHKHSLYSSTCGGKCKASGGKSRGVGKSLEQAKAMTEVQAHGSPKTHLSHLPSIPSCQRSPPPTAYSSFPTLDQTFKRAELCFRPHFVGLSEAGTLAEQLSTKLFPPGLSKDLGVRGGWGHLQAWLLVHIQKWEHVWRSVSLSEAVYFILQWDFKSQAIS